MRKETPTTANVNAFEKARREWYEKYGSSIVGSNRMFIVAMAMCLTCVVMCFTILRMMPLKTVTPYIVKVNGDGMVAANPIEMVSYQPGEAEKKYFLSEWVSKLLVLDKFLTNKNLLEAYDRVRDKAMNEFAEYVSTNKPAEALKLDPLLTRGVKIRSVAFIGDGAALVRVVTETRTGSGQSYTRKNLILTMHFTLVPPKTEQEIFNNPIGLYVTHFDLSEDLN